MTPEIILSLLALCIATLFTPGPNNAMLAASGAKFGFRSTLPHLLGVTLGFPLMMLIVGLALGEVFRNSALLRETLRWGGALILLWLAWKIATSGGIGGKSGPARPMRFIEAAGFQWINPKAWSMAIAAVSQFVTPSDPTHTALIVAGFFVALGLASASTWTYAGQALTRWLTTDRRLKMFNYTMAGLIVLSTVQMLAH